MDNSTNTQSISHLKLQRNLDYSDHLVDSTELSETLPIIELFSFPSKTVSLWYNLKRNASLQFCWSYSYDLLFACHNKNIACGYPWYRSRHYQD